jgi:hypothetical protein
LPAALLVALPAALLAALRTGAAQASY